MRAMIDDSGLILDVPSESATSNRLNFGCSSKILRNEISMSDESYATDER